MESKATVPTTKILMCLQTETEIETEVGSGRSLSQLSVLFSHRYLPTIGLRSLRVFFGILVVSVIMASFKEVAHRQERLSVK